MVSKEEQHQPLHCINEFPQECYAKHFFVNAMLPQTIAILILGE